MHAGVAGHFESREGTGRSRLFFSSRQVMMGAQEKGVQLGICYDFVARKSWHERASSGVPQCSPRFARAAMLATAAHR